jgi:hypothetical protein
LAVSSTRTRVSVKMSVPAAFHSLRRSTTSPTITASAARVIPSVSCLRTTVAPTGAATATASTIPTSAVRIG